MNKVKIFLCSLCCSIVLLISGCESELNLKLDEFQGKPVFYSFIQPDSSLSLSISKSTSMVASQYYETYNNVSVKITRNGNDAGVYTYPDNQLSYKFNNLVFSASDSLSFDVYTNGSWLANASARIPTIVPIEVVDTIRVLRWQVDGRSVWFMRASIQFTDRALVNDFYQLQLFNSKFKDVLNVVDTIDYLKNDPVFYDPSIGVSTLKSIDFQGLFNDLIFNGLTYSLRVYLPLDYFTVPDNEIVFRLYHVDQYYYDYLRARIISEANSGIPLFSNQKMPTNVLNGAGIVAGIAHSEFVLSVK